jgi:cation diffusion facilitator CzcD-associated flavoprotein CzcO
MNNTVFNITIIGAGVVGLAVAEELSAQYSDLQLPRSFPLNTAMYWL